MDLLKQNDLFFPIKKTISGNSVTVIVCNMKSLSRHADNIVSDKRIINNEVKRFTEAQIIPSVSTYKITRTLSFFNVNSNDNENKF